MNGGGKPFLEAISEGYAVAAKEIVDDFYLIYYPRVDVARTAMDGAPAKQDSPSQVRSAPSFVLWPIRPPLTAQRDANPFADAPKNRTGFGGLQFTEVTTLSPRFEWEPFPRSFDLREPDAKDEQFTDVVYDLEVYAGRLNEGGTPPLMHPPVEPNLRQPVYRRFGLQESQHQMDGELSYCGWYFWTVRARFRLNGAPRITEWAGAYATATTLLSPGAYRRGSDSIVWSHPDFPPTNVLYYPFRTLADPAWPSCWDDLDVFNQRLESHVEFPGSELQYR